MRWTFDSTADAFYLYVHEVPSVEQRDLGTGQILDIGSDGQVIGVELLGRRATADLELLERNGVPTFALGLLAMLAASPLPLIGGSSAIDSRDLAPAVSEQREDLLALAFVP